MDNYIKKRDNVDTVIEYTKNDFHFFYPTISKQVGYIDDVIKLDKDIVISNLKLLLKHIEAVSYVKKVIKNETITEKNLLIDNILNEPLSLLKGGTTLYKLLIPKNLQGFLSLNTIFGTGDDELRFYSANSIMYYLQKNTKWRLNKMTKEEFEKNILTWDSIKEKSQEVQDRYKKVIKCWVDQKWLDNVFQQIKLKSYDQIPDKDRKKLTCPE